jgi:hypothetical protein
MHDCNEPANDELYPDWTSKSMLEITLDAPDDFLKVRETLSRIGIASKKEEKTLWQSCHILHKQGRYFIVHFKELFMLDGKPSNFTREDHRRRNTIATLLSDWGLVRIVDKSQVTEVTTLRQIKVIPHSAKGEWKLCVKYIIGQIASARQ